MEYVVIRGTDLRISRIGLGTWAIGGWMWGGTDEAEAVRTVLAALERGITLVDTAPIYGFGRSEEIVGKALRQSARRDPVVLATKVGLDWTAGQVRRDSSPQRIRQEVDDSLRRLGTDRIDLCQVHWPDPATPLAETAAVLRDLLREGKIRAIGVSNFTPEQMRDFGEVAPIHACQPPYNLFERATEADVLPYCLERRIATLTYGALCRGLLGGRIREDTTFEGDDLRQFDPKFRAPRRAGYLEAVQRLEALACKRFERSVSALAARWILDRGISCALWGARSPHQIEAVDDVFGWMLSGADLGEIDTILRETVPDPVGADFMAPPARVTAGIA